MPQPGAQSPPRGGARRRSVSALLGQKSVLLVALIAAMAMVLAGCNVLPSAGAEEGDPEATGELAPGEGEDQAADEGQGGEEGAGDEGAADDGQQGEDPAGEEPPADDGQGEDPAGEEPPADDGQGADDGQAGEEPPPAEEPPVEDPVGPPAEEGDDPPQENPDPEANPDEVEEETQDPGADPCDPAGLPEHNGQQTSVRGSAVCNRGAMGVLPAADKTPQIRIVEPDNGDRVRAGQDISVTVAFENFTPGTFDDPQTQYGVRPFSLDGNGNAVGHSHIYVQRLRGDGIPELALDSFLALNDASADGETLSGEVPGVDRRGRYRMCTDVSGGGHLTFPKGNAQQGPQFDCIQVFIF